MNSVSTLTNIYNYKYYKIKNIYKHIIIIFMRKEY